MIQVPCNLCGSESHRVLYRPCHTDENPAQILSASGGIRGTQTIVKCGECGLIYVNPRVDDETLLISYARAVDTDYGGGGAGRERTFSRGLAYIEKKAEKKGRLLDVGCADGIFVNLAQESGWDALGLEPCRHLAEWGRRNYNVSIVTEDLLHADLREGSFDVITLWDVLEHLADPMAQLQRCHRLLKQDGLVLISYPDIGSFLARLAGRFWWFLLSVHLYYFTRGTIAAYLQKTGFTGPEFAMHWQLLPLDHLIRISRIYIGRPAEVLARAASRAGIGRLLLPYYAAQTDVIARKA